MLLSGGTKINLSSRPLAGIRPSHAVGGDVMNTRSSPLKYSYCAAGRTSKPARTVSALLLLEDLLRLLLLLRAAMESGSTKNQGGPRQPTCTRYTCSYCDVVSEAFYVTHVE
jgi:hypothetical protein